jgi:hypothetical protein
VEQHEGLGVADDLHLGPAQQDLLDGGGVVGLHMVDDEIVQRPAGQQRAFTFSSSWRQADQSTVSNRTVFSSSSR